MSVCIKLEVKLTLWAHLMDCCWCCFPKSVFLCDISLHLIGCSVDNMTSISKKCLVKSSALAIRVKVKLSNVSNSCNPMCSFMPSFCAVSNFTCANKTSLFHLVGFYPTCSLSPSLSWIVLPVPFPLRVLIFSISLCKHFSLQHVHNQRCIC